VVGLIPERFGERAFKTVISKNVKLEEAHSRAQSIYAYEPNSPRTSPEITATIRAGNFSEHRGS
jgi:cellulose biosynthesis protein BcsQ